MCYIHQDIFSNSLKLLIVGGLLFFSNKSGTLLEKIKKKLQRLFKEEDLEIKAESNQKIVNYLDVILT